MTDEKKPDDVDDGPSIFDDLEKLKADSAMPLQSDDGGAPPPSGPKWQRHGTFVPREWELRLKKVSRVSTYHLALELLYRHWRDGRQTKRRDGVVVVSREVMRAAGVSGRSMGNALCQLERLGLIAMVRVKRRSPRVFPLRIPPQFWK